MLKRFEVEGFKGFKDKLVFDLCAREYEFNNGIIKHGLVNKAIVYGKNGIGKSCLGIALFDIVWHLTDKERMSQLYLQNYLNLEGNREFATFKYFFKFDNDEIVYEYSKSNPDYLISERVWINGRRIINYDYFDDSVRFIDKDIVGNLNIDLADNKLSIVKYIYRNTPTNTIPLINKMVQFCERMLWYRSLSEGNMYAGYTNGVSILVEALYKYNGIVGFQEFLKENDIYYSLEFVDRNGEHELMVRFDNGRLAPFHSIASTGTKALFLFYIWSISSFDDISFLFIDEFDAFFHYEAAENIVLRLNNGLSFQTVLTSHNTYLMQNKLARPDCCFVMTKGKITSLYNATAKEIREAHNLEKMYINGAFNE